MINLKQSWTKLAERERTMIVVVIAFLVLFFVYLLLWGPLYSSMAGYRDKVSSQQQLLHYLQKSAQRISILKSQGITVGATAAHGNLLSAVEESVSAQQLSTYLKQVTAPKSNEIQLTFDNVPFDNLMGWLQNITESQSLSVEHFSATRSATMGVATTVSMTLVRV